MRVAGHPLGRSNALILGNILLPPCNTCINYVGEPERFMARQTRQTAAGKWAPLPRQSNSGYD